MTLVDTSAWIAHFRAEKPVDLERWVPFEEIVTCSPWCRKSSALKQRDVAR